MKATAAQVASIEAAILSAVQPGKACEWSDIMRAVEAAGLKIKNWMLVRAVLQGLLNAGRITRLPNVHAEQYAAA